MQLARPGAGQGMAEVKVWNWQDCLTAGTAGWSFPAVQRELPVATLNLLLHHVISTVRFYDVKFKAGQ